VTQEAADRGERSGGEIGDAQRILILGCSGSGKTRLAGQLARDTGLPTYHLDDEHFGPAWEGLDPQTWAALQRRLAAGDRWIIEGNWIGTIPVRVKRAQLVVMLDAGSLRCLYRVARRAWRIRRGHYADLPARVRAEAVAGRPFRATSAFHQLLWTIIRFRFRTWDKVIDHVAGNPSASLVVVVNPGFACRRLAAVRRRLRRRGVDALVIPPAEIHGFMRARPPGQREMIERRASHADPGRVASPRPELLQCRAPPAGVQHRCLSPPARPCRTGAGRGRP
jgi:hypothetical protein